MYKGHMDKAKEGRFEGGRQGWVGWGQRGRVKMETTVPEQQQQFFLKKEKNDRKVCKRKIMKKNKKEFVSTEFSACLPGSPWGYYSEVV